MDSKFKNRLATIIISFWVVLHLICIFKDCTPKLLDQLNMVIMAIVGYYFGSSDGSAYKTKVLKDIKNGNSKLHTE